jgi:cell division protein FtsB
MSTNIVVKTFRSDRLKTLLIGLGIVVAIALLSAYYFGRHGLQGQIEQLESKLSEQDARNGSQQARIDTLEFRIAELTLGESVSELAATDLQAVVVQQQGKIARLESEAIYYRNLMSPGAGDREVFIHRVDLLPSVDNRYLNYEILLTHADPDGAHTVGRIGITLAGVVENRQTLIDAGASGLIEPEALEYDFRYFQNFAGQLRLPEGFQPATLLLEVTSEAGKVLEQQRFDVPIREA